MSDRLGGILVCGAPLPRLWLSSQQGNNALHFVSLLICHVVPKGNQSTHVSVCHPNGRKTILILIRGGGKWQLNSWGKPWSSMWFLHSLDPSYLWLWCRPITPEETLRDLNKVLQYPFSQKAAAVKHHRWPQIHPLFTVRNMFILEQSALTSPPPQGFCWMFWLDCLLTDNDFKHTGFSSHYGNPLVCCWDVFCPLCSCTVNTENIPGLSHVG